MNIARSDKLSANTPPCNIKQIAKIVFIIFHYTQRSVECNQKAPSCDKIISFHWTKLLNGMMGINPNVSQQNIRR